LKPETRRSKLKRLAFRHKLPNFGNPLLTHPKPMYKYILPIALFASLLACGHQKNVTKNNQPTHWRQVNQKNAPDPNVNIESRVDYHPSETRETDLLNTTLHVRFDWAKKRMYGNATISARPYFYPTSTLKLDARGMEINRVAILMRDATNPMMLSADTIKLQYTYDGKILNIDLGRP
jgi:hypothetical protein